MLLIRLKARRNSRIGAHIIPRPSPRKKSPGARRLRRLRRLRRTGCRRSRACEGPYRAVKALLRRHPRLLSHLALGLAGALRASPKPSLRWRPSQSQNLREAPRKILGDPRLPTRLENPLRRGPHQPHQVCWPGGQSQAAGRPHWGEGCQRPSLSSWGPQLTPNLTTQHPGCLPPRPSAIQPLPPGLITPPGQPRTILLPSISQSSEAIKPALAKLGAGRSETCGSCQAASAEGGRPHSAIARWLAQLRPSARACTGQVCPRRGGREGGDEGKPGGREMPSERHGASETDQQRLREVVMDAHMTHQETEGGETTGKKRELQKIRMGSTTTVSQRPNERENKEGAETDEINRRHITESVTLDPSAGGGPKQRHECLVARQQQGLHQLVEEEPHDVRSSGAGCPRGSVEPVGKTPERLGGQASGGCASNSHVTGSSGHLSGADLRAKRRTELSELDVNSMATGPSHCPSFLPSLKEGSWWVTPGQKSLAPMTPTPRVGVIALTSWGAPGGTASSGK
ncbi:1-phosphatidylinositol 4; 5-bisphosphate phosphodiesterase beta-3 [Camelus dromedarius]|uniref:1-phosphatidylinositol 4 n=1 Tax=Camelus dromedarius TaxID=9838 RepID=A0A5N4CBC2_CAMDR|nr:1-phosphatidylinositol 4; 5-bisphosphate phosphodiesterase beta-3 [Camelus dromedarius]